jgi:repressor LexA
MEKLTHRQQQILGFIERQQQKGFSPTFREIAHHFGLRSTGSVIDHICALKRKGVLQNENRSARSFQVVSALSSMRKSIMDLPLYGSIPAGSPQERTPEIQSCVSVDAETLGIRPTARTFALEVKGDSMIGKHILDGDVVILEHGVSPKPGDVVAALIDRENTLKTFLVEKGKPFLKAENPKYPQLVPAEELIIQGVMVALIRKHK